MSDSALAMLEFTSIADGTRIADAMVKRAPLALFTVGSVQPGKYLVLIGGEVAAVEESHAEGLRLAGETLSDEILLPDAHEQVQDAIAGVRALATGDALGVIETSAIPSNIRAADKAVKAAHATIVEIRFGDGLGGKAITHLSGAVHDVEAAIEAARASIGAGVQLSTCIIPMQDPELRARIDRATEFRP